MPIVQPLLGAPDQGVREAAEGVYRVNYDSSGKSASRNEAAQAKAHLQLVMVDVLDRQPAAQLRNSMIGSVTLSWTVMLQLVALAIATDGSPQ